MFPLWVTNWTAAGTRQECELQGQAKCEWVSMEMHAGGYCFLMVNAGDWKQVTVSSSLLRTGDIQTLVRYLSLLLQANAWLFRKVLNHRRPKDRKKWASPVSLVCSPGSPWGREGRALGSGSHWFSVIP